MRRSLPRVSPSIGRSLCAGIVLAGAACLPALAQVEPLTIRVSDAEGEAGGPVAVVLRTYASRPVSQGRLGLNTSNFARIAEELLGSGPFASFEGGVIFGVGGDVVETFTFDPETQTLDAQFASASASINAADGVLAVFHFTLAEGLAAGSTYDLLFDLGTSFLVDCGGLPVLWQPRAGELDIRAAATNRALEVDGGEVHPGSAIDVEVQTLEPFAITDGRIEVQYATDILSGPVQVRTDPRHGSVTPTVSFPAPGRVRIDFVSPGGDFNLVPGALFTIRMPTRSDLQFGLTRAVSAVVGETFLNGPGGPWPLRFEGDQVEFVNDPFVFYDNFEGGSAAAWSLRVPCAP